MKKGGKSVGIGALDIPIPSHVLGLDLRLLCGPQGTSSGAVPTMSSTCLDKFHLSCQCSLFTQILQISCSVGLSVWLLVLQRWSLSYNFGIYDSVPPTSAQNTNI